MASPKICKVDGCGKRHHAHGYCAPHAAKFRRHGDPLAGRRGASPGAPLKWIYDHARYAGDDCLVWPFERGGNGYGTIKHEGKRRPASRVICQIVYGPPPTPRHEAAHSCGNGHNGCVNWSHLRWATPAENTADKSVHGTLKRGEEIPQSKLTRTDIIAIRSMYGVVDAAKIAEKYGIHIMSVHRIWRRKTWEWL